MQGQEKKIRIIPVKDVIEPRVKIQGTGKGFPGAFSKMEQVGEGKVNILHGAAVVTIGDIVGFQEGVIDMWGVRELSGHLFLKLIIW